MRLLIDTQAILWYVDQDHLLSRPAHAAITDPSNDLLMSAATLWEIAIKLAVGKLQLSLPYRPWIARAVADLQLGLLPIRDDHAERQITLPFHNRDPFDRMLAAQALVEDVSLVSADSIFDAYGVTRIWN